MKTKISIILLIFSFVFLFSGTTLFEKSFDEINHSTFNMKSGDYLYNNDERKITEHSNTMTLNYEISLKSVLFIISISF